MHQILHRISHKFISTLQLNSGNLFRYIRQKIDLVKLLQFLEYDSNIICNPHKVNHHNANTGEPTYKQLVEKCTEITNDSMGENEPDLPFKSFEFVVYTKCDGDESPQNQTFHITHTIKTNEKISIQNDDKKGKFLTSSKKDEIMSIVKEENETNSSPVKSRTILDQITQFQQTSNLRFGIIDGLHRLTAFNTILRKNEDSIFHNMNCQCNIYIIKQEEGVEYSRLQNLFNAKSKLISKNQNKSIPHNVYDGIV